VWNYSTVTVTATAAASIWSFWYSREREKSGDKTSIILRDDEYQRLSDAGKRPFISDARSQEIPIIARQCVESRNGARSECEMDSLCRGKRELIERLVATDSAAAAVNTNNGRSPATSQRRPSGLTDARLPSRPSVRPSVCRLSIPRHAGPEVKPCAMNVVSALATAVDW